MEAITVLRMKGFYKKVWMGDGNQRHATEVVADEVLLLGSK
jgi:hypothetical protein